MDAVDTLSKGDHHILGMISHPDVSTRSPRLPGDRLRLWVAGFALVAMATCWFLGAIHLLDKYKIGPSSDRDRTPFLGWAGASGS